MCAEEASVKHVSLLNNVEHKHVKPEDVVLILSEPMVSSGLMGRYHIDLFVKGLARSRQGDL